MPNSKDENASTVTVTIVEAVKQLSNLNDEKTKLDLELDTLRYKSNQLDLRKDTKKKLWDARTAFLKQLDLVLDLGKKIATSATPTSKSEGAAKISKE